MTGFCDCSAGFMGLTCHQRCPNGSYGLNCASQCQCSMTGTRLCNHVNGSCDCLDSWSGELCDSKVEGITSNVLVFIFKLMMRVEDLKPSYRV